MLENPDRFGARPYRATRCENASKCATSIAWERVPTADTFLLRRLRLQLLKGIDRRCFSRTSFRAQRTGRA